MPSLLQELANTTRPRASSAARASRESLVVGGFKYINHKHGVRKPCSQLHLVNVWLLKNGRQTTPLCGDAIAAAGVCGGAFRRSCWWLVAGLVGTCGTLQAWRQHAPMPAPCVLGVGFGAERSGALREAATGLIVG